MTKSFWQSVLAVVAAGSFLGGEAHADTFEFLTYTPPSGWVNQPLREGIAYRRPSGIGLITFYPSHASSGSAPDEFVKMWRARVEPTLPGPAPQSANSTRWRPRGGRGCSAGRRPGRHNDDLTRRHHGKRPHYRCVGDGG